MKFDKLIESLLSNIAKEFESKPRRLKGSEAKKIAQEIYDEMDTQREYYFGRSDAENKKRIDDELEGYCFDGYIENDEETGVDNYTFVRDYFVDILKAEEGLDLDLS